MVGSSQSTIDVLWRFLKNLRNNSQYSRLNLISRDGHIITNISLLRIDHQQVRPQSSESPNYYRGIKAMKNERFPGFKRIVPELMKCGGKYLDRYLLQLINSCLE